MPGPNRVGEKCGKPECNAPAVETPETWANYCQFHRSALIEGQRVLVANANESKIEAAKRERSSKRW